MCLPPKTTLPDLCGSQMKGHSSLEPCFSSSHPFIPTHIASHLRTLPIYDECQLLWTFRDSMPFFIGSQGHSHSQTVAATLALA